MYDLDVCRLCLKNLYDEKQSLLDEPHHMMLETLAPIEVNVYNQLTTVSCPPCIQKLDLFYKFRQHIIKSDEILRAQVTNKVQQEIANEQCHNTPFNRIATNESCSPSNIESPIRQYDTDNCVEPDDSDTKEWFKDAGMKVEDVSTSTSITQNDAALITPTINVQCIICLKDVSRNKIKAHTMMHYNKSQNCPNCNTMLGDATAYQKHIELKHSDEASTESQCLQCSLSFKYKVLFYIHIQAHHALLRKAVLERLPSDKLKTSSLHALKQCSVCSAHIKATNLLRHMKIHTAGPQVCDLCGAMVANEGSLRTHMHYTHNKNRLLCDICGQLFKRITTYKLHKKKHENKKDHICEKCGKTFFSTTTLLKHQRRIHLKVTLHTCTYCDKKFFSRTSFKTHLRQHTNETPYRCDICSESFKQNVSLRNHKKNKHNIKEPVNVACTKCDKKFKSQHALTSHMRVHN